MAATHELESRGQASSAALKAASHSSHSLPGEPRTGVVSSLETQRATPTTHKLESQGQASSAALKRSEPQQPLTNWRAEDGRRQQPCNAASHGSHSHTSDP